MALLLTPIVAADCSFGEVDAMRIVIVGSGAMGQLFGARLSFAGQDVTLADIDQATVDAINDRGVSCAFGEWRQVVQVPACQDKELVGPYDLAILFTKAYDSEAALKACVDRIGAEALVLTLQNGLGNADLLRRYVDDSRVLVGMTTYNADRGGTAQVSSSGEGTIRMMPLSGVIGEREQAVWDVLEESGFTGAIVEDAWADIWQKVAYNSALNATSAICRVPCGGMGVMNKGMDLCSELVDETCTVAAAYGVEVDAGAVKRAMRAEIFGSGRNHVSSMTQDVLAGRRTEVTNLNGGVVHKAREKGLSAPYNEAMFCLLRSIESTYDLQLG